MTLANKMRILRPRHGAVAIDARERRHISSLGWGYSLIESPGPESRHSGHAVPSHQCI